jgi:tetratricopeptide (TPR) repeat protein
MLLLLGGLLLLLKGKRFVNECVLLSLPLLRSCIPALAATPPSRVLRPVATLLVALFLLMPFFFMHHFFAHPPRYPVSARELPEGVSLFLKQNHAAGALLNHPNSGGYLQWALYPRCRIFMDMQVPFLFTEADFSAARGAYTQKPVLREILSRYHPAFITVPIDLEGFTSMIGEHPQYRMVFFDDAEVLYVDASQQRALAEAYEIRSIDPFTLYRESTGPRPPDGPALNELKRLAAVFPDGGIVNASLAAHFLHQARYSEAIACAEAIIRTYPESHLGYKLKADALARLGRCREAIRCYKRALERSDGELRQLIEREAASCSGRLRTRG